MKFKESAGSIDLYAESMNQKVYNSQTSGAIPQGTVVQIDTSNGGNGWQAGNAVAYPYIPVVTAGYPITPAPLTAATLTKGVVVSNGLPDPSINPQFPAIGQVAVMGFASVQKPWNTTWQGGELLVPGTYGGATQGMAVVAGANPNPGTVIGVAMPCAALAASGTAYGDIDLKVL